MTILTIKQAKSILSVLKRLDYEAEIRTDYSGRFMFGRTCLGFVVANPESVGAAVAEGLAGTDVDPLKMMSLSAWDHIGLNFIVYFPSISMS